MAANISVYSTNFLKQINQLNHMMSSIHPLQASYDTSCCAKLIFHSLFTMFILTCCLHIYLFCISAFDVSVVLCLLLPGALLCSVLFLSGLLSTGVWGGGEGPWGLGGLLLELPPLCCNDGQASLLAVFGRVWNIHTAYIHDHYLQFSSRLILMTFLK